MPLDRSRALLWPLNGAIFRFASTARAWKSRVLCFPAVGAVKRTNVFERGPLSLPFSRNTFSAAAAAASTPPPLCSCIIVLGYRPASYVRTTSAAAATTTRELVLLLLLSCALLFRIENAHAHSMERKRRKIVGRKERTSSHFDILTCNASLSGGLGKKDGNSLKTKWFFLFDILIL